MPNFEALNEAESMLNLQLQKLIFFTFQRSGNDIKKLVFTLFFYISFYNFVTFMTMKDIRIAKIRQ